MTVPSAPGFARVAARYIIELEYLAVAQPDIAFMQEPRIMACPAVARMLIQIALGKQPCASGEYTARPIPYFRAAALSPPRRISSSVPFSICLSKMLYPPG